MNSSLRQLPYMFSRRFVSDDGMLHLLVVLYIHPLHFPFSRGFEIDIKSFIILFATDKLLFW